MARRGPQRDDSKERLWRRLLRLWQRSGQTIRDFCAEHAVSEASFYAWRRTLAQRQHAATPAALEQQPTFVPVRVVAAAPASACEVVLPGDRVVRVPAGFDAASLRQLLAILQEERPC